MTGQTKTGSLETSRPPIIYASLSVNDLFKGERRLESETYLTGGFAIRRVIESSGVPYVALSELAQVWLPSRLKGVPVTAAHGAPYFTATQIFNIRPTARKWLAISKITDVGQLYVKPGWILVTRSGNVGDALVTHSLHDGIIVSDDLLRVQVKEPAILGYLYAFLRTRYGRFMLRSSQYGSIIKHLEPEHLFDIPVPLVSEDVRRSVHEKILKAFKLRDQAFALIKQAEERYAREIGVKPDSPPAETGYSVPTSEVFGQKRRLDGYYYNPAAETALYALKKSKKKLEPLVSLTEKVFGVPRFKHVYTAKGIPYLDSEDIFKTNPEITKFIPEETEEGRRRVQIEKYFVQRGWLLMACSGQIYGINGSVTLAESWHENKIVSNHIIRIVPSKEKDAVPAGYLQMALGHPVLGRSLVRRLAFGTEVPEIDPGDVRNFPVARLATDVEGEIAALVQQASALRMKGDEEENRIVNVVERAIDDKLGGSPSLKIAEQAKPKNSQPIERHA